MSAVSISDLVEAGVHFGHQTRLLNPKMAQYILAEDNGLHIIDLQQTLPCIALAYQFVKETVARGEEILFVGTKSAARDAIAEQAMRVGMPYVNQHWLGGMLGGTREMSKLPGAIWVVDIKKEHIAVSEARRLGIPVIAILDTNSDPDEVDYKIPGNDNAIGSAALLTRVIADAVAEGLVARAAGMADASGGVADRLRRLIEGRGRGCLTIGVFSDSAMEQTGLSATLAELGMSPGNFGDLYEYVLGSKVIRSDSSSRTVARVVRGEQGKPEMQIAWVDGPPDDSQIAALASWIHAASNYAVFAIAATPVFDANIPGAGREHHDRRTTVPIMTRLGNTVDRQEVEILAIGAGPANLALGVALEELASELASQTLIIEQHDTVVWQRGLLLPWSQSQMSFLKDLVTRRNPCSRFSFINFLHSTGRLDDFINLGSFTPYRLEISDYLSWVADSLSEVRIQSGRRAVSIEPGYGSDGEVQEWLVGLADGSEIACRNLVIGAGRDPHIPRVFNQLPRERLIHSTEFSSRITGLDRNAEHRIVVLGGAQSAAEMLWASHQEFPNAQCTMVMRSIGLAPYENSKFTNELFYPSFVDEFYAALPEARDQLLREMHRTHYSGLNPALLEVLYRQMYLDKLTGVERLHMVTMSEVADARMSDSEVVLTLSDRKNGGSEELRCDLVLLGTGFNRQMPKLVRDLAASVSVEEVSVSRSYRMNLPPNVRAGCYLQGVNEATHGIADSLLSLLAIRSGDIVIDLLAHRSESKLEATIAVPWGARP